MFDVPIAKGGMLLRQAFYEFVKVMLPDKYFLQTTQVSGEEFTLSDHQYDDTFFMYTM